MIPGMNEKEIRSGRQTPSAWQQRSDFDPVMD